jgi:succinate dehydrogenase / fumarate reductase, membrane anchor subunit
MIGEATVRRMASAHSKQGSTFELYSWFFMRVSGAILLFIAVFHLFYMHFVVDVTKIQYNVIVDRWLGPAGTFWRTFDAMLLVFGFTHGTNGVRFVIEDYVHSDGWRATIKTLLYLAYFVVAFLGAYIIFAFKPD